MSSEEPTPDEAFGEFMQQYQRAVDAQEFQDATRAVHDMFESAEECPNRREMLSHAEKFQFLHKNNLFKSFPPEFLFLTSLGHLESGNIFKHPKNASDVIGKKNSHY